LLSLFVGGCVYFNTFYNAQRYFKEGEKEYVKNGKLTPQARTNYEKTIEKCAKILEFHPNSRYVDDAVYLMGVSYHRLGEKEKARRKFEELLQYFPRSRYREEALLELGKVLLDLQQPDSAKIVLAKVKGKYKEEVDLLLAKAYYVEDRDEEALVVLSKYVKEVKREDLKKEALLLAAKAAKRLKKFEDAEEYLRSYLQLSLTSEEEIEVKELLGDILFEKEDFEDAKDVYQSLDLPPNSPKEAEIKVKLALCEKEIGNVDKAKEMLREVINEKRSSEEGVRAQYELALILEEQDSVEEAVKLYEEAGKSFGDFEYKKRALLRYQALKNLVEMSSSEASTERIRLAEIYLVELNRPEDAEKIYLEILKEGADASVTARALYALTYISLYLKGDKESARKFYSRLIEDFGTTVYAKEAKNNFGEKLGLPKEGMP
jgi:TolA-binding protein